MRTSWINIVALLVIASGAQAAGAQRDATVAQEYNYCAGGDYQCWCSGACIANNAGCQCL